MHQDFLSRKRRWERSEALRELGPLVLALAGLLAWLMLILYGKGA
jgi:hypothetical protein